MPSLIESLVGDVQRKDDKRLQVVRRPAPRLPRDLFELVGSMGRDATPEGMVRGFDLTSADPRDIYFASLGRWPTTEEMTALPANFQPARLLRQLLRTREFRETFLRRIFDAFPERRRLFQIRIPRSGSEHVAATAASYHPILPLDFGDARSMPLEEVFMVLGQTLFRFASTNTMFLAVPEMKLLLFPPTALSALQDPFGWRVNQPPLRPGDQVFATIRDPADLQLSLANDIVGRLRAGPEQDSADSVSWREYLGDLPKPGQGTAWKDIGRQIVRQLPLRNPICMALGEGTAQSAIAYCRLARVELVGLERQDEWVRTAMSTEPAARLNASQRLLRAADLGPEEQEALEARIDEDRVFYETFLSHYDRNLVTSINGAVL